MAKSIDNELALREHLEARVAQAEEVVRQREAQQAAREALAKADPGDPRAAGRVLARRIAEQAREQADRAEIRHRMELHNAKMRVRRATSSQHGTGWLHPKPTVNVSADQAAGMVMRLRQADPKPRGRF